MVCNQPFIYITYSNKKLIDRAEILNMRCSVVRILSFPSMRVRFFSPKLDSPCQTEVLSRRPTAASSCFTTAASWASKDDVDYEARPPCAIPPTITTTVLTPRLRHQPTPNPLRCESRYQEKEQACHTTVGHSGFRI